MSGQLVYECPILLPSLDRAKRLVPEQFVPCYEWFIENTGEKISRLPHRMERKPNTPIPLSRDSGIYVPGAAHVAYASSRRYALSVHSSGARCYNDRKPIPLADGTWIVDYAAHQGSDLSQGYNEALMNCLADGVPVGVMMSERKGYRVLGLALVERYNGATQMFTLHGPISNSTESAGSFAARGFDALPAKSQQVMIEYDGSDERRVATAQIIRREQQGRFRSDLMDAYAGACAISGTSVETVLQAAHINPYRGRRSQVVQNGILLRADLHLLYDAHLISVEPDTHVLRLSDRLGNTDYERYNLKRLSETVRPELSPSNDLLAVHYEQFRQENHVLVA